MYIRGRLLFAASAVLAVSPVHGEIDHTRSLSVVQVQAYPAAGTGRVALGSGVVVGPRQIATNCHVTRLAGTVLVARGGERIRAASQRVDVEKDLCLLDVPPMPLPVARRGRSSARLKIGEPLYLYGYPRAVGMAFSQGHVKSLHAFGNGRVIETSADLNEGASGGGLFDGDGHLVGLATFFSAGHRGRNFAIPVDWIAELARKRARVIAPVGGVPFWQDVAHLPAFLKVPGH